MEFTNQQATSLGGRPMAQEPSHPLPQAPFSTSNTQIPAYFTQTSSQIPTHMQVIGSSSVLPLQNTLIPLPLKLDCNNFAI